MAEHMAIALMKQHGVWQEGWRFQWSHGKRQLGSAQVTRYRNRRFGPAHEQRTIRLSRHLVELNDQQVVRDTLLHEIAHAIAGVEHGHDAKWKAICQRIGAKPQRLADENVRLPVERWRLVCTHCGEVLAKRHRQMAPARLRQSYCLHCGPSSKGKLRFIAAANPECKSA